MLIYKENKFSFNLLWNQMLWRGIVLFALYPLEHTQLYSYTRRCLIVWRQLIKLPMQLRRLEYVNKCTVIAFIYYLVFQSHMFVINSSVLSDARRHLLAPHVYWSVLMWVYTYYIKKCCQHCFRGNVNSVRF